jgi:inosose dehydratase
MPKPAAASPAIGIARYRPGPDCRTPDWRDFGARLTELADRLADRGIHLAYHHHMGTIVENEVEIDHLMAVTGDSVGLLLDHRRRPQLFNEPSSLSRAG